MKRGMRGEINFVPADWTGAPGKTVQIDTAFAFVRGDVADAGGDVGALRSNRANTCFAWWPRMRRGTDPKRI